MDRIDHALPAARTSRFVFAILPSLIIRWPAGRTADAWAWPITPDAWAIFLGAG